MILAVSHQLFFSAYTFREISPVGRLLSDFQQLFDRSAKYRLLALDADGSLNQLRVVSHGGVEFFIAQ